MTMGSAMHIPYVNAHQNMIYSNMWAYIEAIKSSKLNQPWGRGWPTFAAASKVAALPPNKPGGSNQKMQHSTLGEHQGQVLEDVIRFQPLTLALSLLVCSISIAQVFSF